MKITSKKISFIGQKGIPAEFVGTSGIEFYVESLAKNLINQRNKVSCYVRNWATSKSLKKYQKIKLIHLPSINTKHLDALSHSLISSCHACFNDVDIVWYQAIGPAFFSCLPKLCGKNVYTTIHGLDWRREKWNWCAKLFLKLSEKILVKFSDEIFVVSNDLQKYYWKRYHRKTIYLPPIVPKLRKLKPNIVTKKYGLKGNDYILYLGRFVPEKRIDWLIKAYQQLKPKDIKLVLAGGSSHTDKYTRYLYDLSKNNPNIIFTGYVFGKEKSELLSNCRLFILPSSLEGNALTLLEALKLKQNCLASDINIHKRIAKINTNLQIFKRNNFPDFVKKINL